MSIKCSRRPRSKARKRRDVGRDISEDKEAFESPREAHPEDVIEVYEAYMQSNVGILVLRVAQSETSSASESPSDAEEQFGCEQARGGNVSVASHASLFWGDLSIAGDQPARKTGRAPLEPNPNLSCPCCEGDGERLDLGAIESHAAELRRLWEEEGAAALRALLAFGGPRPKPELLPPPSSLPAGSLAGHVSRFHSVTPPPPPPVPAAGRSLFAAGPEAFLRGFASPGGESFFTASPVYFVLVRLAAPL
eukprot:tig00020571_g11489.t1